MGSMDEMALVLGRWHLAEWWEDLQEEAPVGPVFLRGVESFSMCELTEAHCSKTIKTASKCPAPFGLKAGQLIYPPPPSSCPSSSSSPLPDVVLAELRNGSVEGDQGRICGAEAFKPKSGGSAGTRQEWIGETGLPGEWGGSPSAAPR